MRHLTAIALFILIGCASPEQPPAPPAAIAPATAPAFLREAADDVTAGLGVNIHFRGAPEKELGLVTSAGFRFIRMDFDWAAVEKEKGVYDFTEYDQLTDALEKRGIRALYILDYGNKLYEVYRSVLTDKGREAFAAFAAAAAARYKGRGVIWEIWNEPNLDHFWEPKPNPKYYTMLAKAAVPAIRKADPQAVCVGPALARNSLDFLRGCFEMGLLDVLDAVTIHSYRNVPPETLDRDIRILRAMIAVYRPDRPDLPILSGEWGYPDMVQECPNPEKQGQFLARMFLTNISLGIPLSIWYDLKDDGTDPKEVEHHFGAYTFDGKPKPASQAMQRLVAALKGMRFVRRLPSAPNDHALLFTDGRRDVVAAWTTADAHEAQIAGGTKAALTGDPLYVTLPK